ncbi:hypothetical protein F2Q69_00005310 [Brassica cretica]|nr:hypothetical protein F2Q69_00005310 [Brassica cretica]
MVGSTWSKLRGRTIEESRSRYRLHDCGVGNSTGGRCMRQTHHHSSNWNVALVHYRLVAGAVAAKDEAAEEVGEDAKGEGELADI